MKFVVCEDEYMTEYNDGFDRGYAHGYESGYAQGRHEMLMELSTKMSGANSPQDNCPHTHTKRLVLPANKRKQFDEPFAYHCTDCKRTFGEKP